MSNINENKTENLGKLIFRDGHELTISSMNQEISKDIYTGTNNVIEIILPENVKKIKPRSFSWYKDLKNIRLPEG